MVCKHCKAKVRYGRKRCPYCGAALFRHSPVAIACVCAAVILAAVLAGGLMCKDAEESGQDGQGTYEFGQEYVQNGNGQNAEEQSGAINTDKGTETETYMEEYSNAEMPHQITGGADNSGEAEKRIEEESFGNSKEETKEDSEQKTKEALDERNSHQSAAEAEASNAAENSEVPTESEEEQAALPVSDRFAGMTPEEISEWRERSDFTARLEYIGTRLTHTGEEEAEPAVPGKRKKSLKADVLYVQEVLKEMEAGNCGIQAFFEEEYPEKKAEYQVYRMDNRSEAVAIRYIPEESDAYTFLFRGGQLRYVQNDQSLASAWFMDDVMLSELSPEEQESLTGIELQNRNDYFELSDKEKKEYLIREEYLLTCAKEVYQRAILERNFTRLQMLVILENSEGDRLEYDPEKAEIQIEITSDDLKEIWKGETLTAQDFYYIEETGWGVDFYLPAYSKPYRMTIRTNLTRETEETFLVDYDFSTDGLNQYQNLGQMIIEIPEEVLK